MPYLFRITCSLMASLLVATATFAQPGPGPGGGPGKGFRGGRGAEGSGPNHGPGVGRGMGRGPAFARDQGAEPQHAHDDRHDEDHEVFQFLLQHHEKITRTVTELDDGVNTLTESDDPEIAAKIKEHVEWMQYRIEENHPIRMRDPLFAELFRHTDKIKMKHEDTEKGVRVIETSDDPYVARLIQAHAEVVSGFVARGFAEAMKNHAVPGNTSPADTPSPQHPVIANYGSVVQLADAAQQPREGTKLLVDITQGSEAGKLNPAIEKVAKYVNIYAGAGKDPAQASFAIVLHGGATLAVLNHDAYTARFNTQNNPHLDCLHQLHEAGVAIYVCGQSLLKEGGRQEEVVVFVDTAVSALTAVVNLQADGYSYVPLLK